MTKEIIQTPKATMTRIDAEVQRDNVRHVLNTLTAEYWATNEHLTKATFKSRRAQLEAMKHQGRLIDAIDALTTATTMVDRIVSELPREEEQ